MYVPEAPVFLILIYLLFLRYIARVLLFLAPSENVCIYTQDLQDALHYSGWLGFVTWVTYLL